MASTIVLPAPLSSTMSSTSHCWVRGSSAAVGSSKSSTSGFITSTDAIATRFFCAAGQLVRRAVGQLGDLEHGQRVVDPLPRPRRCARPMFSGPNAISSRTVGENTWASEFWKMKPTRERKPRENCSSSRWSSVTVCAERVEGAGVGEHEPVEHLEQRRLAAAVGAEQRDLLAARRPSARRRRAPGTGRGRSSEASSHARSGVGSRSADGTVDPEHGRCATATQATTHTDVERADRGRRSACARCPCSRATPSPCAPLPTARAPCRTARRPTRRRTRRPDATSASRADRAGLAGGVHVGHRAEEVEQVAVRHAEHEDEHLRHEQRAERGQQARPRRREREQHDERDRRRRPA